VISNQQIAVEEFLTEIRTASVLDILVCKYSVRQKWFCFVAKVWDWWNQLNVRRRETEEVCRTKAEAVRYLSRQAQEASPLGKPHFPEILAEPLFCWSCGQETLILVHPNMMCYDCWEQLFMIDLRFQTDLSELLKTNPGDGLKEAQRRCSEGYRWFLQAVIVK